MLTNKVQLETKTSTSEHTYLCASNTPLTEVYEALGQFRSYVYGRLKEMEDQQKAAADAAQSQEPDGN